MLTVILAYSKLTIHLHLIYMNYSINNNIKILVIGDLMLDHYIYGNCNRISPEAPVQVVEVKKDEYTLGGAGNVIKNLKVLGCDTNIISIVGEDDYANVINTQLEAAGVNANGILRDKSRCTTLKSRVLVANHQLIRLDREDTQPVEKATADKLIDILKKEINNYNLVLVSDYNKGLLSDYLLNQIFSICREASVKTLIDPKGNNYTKYRGCNMVKPNKKEAIQASGIQITDKDSLAAACKKIKEITGCDDVVVTMSEEGMAMYVSDELTVIPTKALSVIDVTGAGDTVLASLGVAISSGYNLFEACDFANHAAAVVVSKVGSATATIGEISHQFLAMF
ncbi:rfaE bifunctional protein, domain I [Mucilaginibacter polytrichastri]|nr:rfaE bifunctional protein, domain I [Mucilaginibacter polytrichastri]